MKQHITIEQARELTNDQAVKIYNLLYEKDYKIEDLELRGKAGGNFKDKEGWYNSAFELNLTIGKMIEILERDDKYFVNIDCTVEGYQVYLNKTGSIGYMESLSNCKFFQGETRVDALWEAVKEVI